MRYLGEGGRKLPCLGETQIVVGRIITSSPFKLFEERVFFVLVWFGELV